LLFLVSIAGVATVVDDYEGGDRIAEIGASLFDLFMFPLIILDWLRIDVEPGWVFYLLLFFNFIVNSFVITSLLNLCYLRLKKRLIRRAG
jgi:hypothetical protein